MKKYNKKILFFLILTLIVTSLPNLQIIEKETKASAKETYHAYLGFETDNGIFREAWNHEEYGRNAQNNSNYTYETEIGVRKDNGVEWRRETALYNANDISSDGKYKVHALMFSGYDWKSLGATSFNKLFISTDIPCSISGVVFSDVTLNIDDKLVETYDIIPQKGDVNDCYQLMIADIYAPEDGTVDCTYDKNNILQDVPESYIEIDFTISGLDDATSSVTNDEEQINNTASPSVPWKLNVYPRFAVYPISLNKNEVLYVQVGDKTYNSSENGDKSYNNGYTYIQFDSVITGNGTAWIENTVTGKKSDTCTVTVGEFCPWISEFDFSVSETSVSISSFYPAPGASSTTFFDIDTYLNVSDGVNTYSKKTTQISAEFARYTGSTSFPQKEPGTTLSYWISDSFGDVSKIYTYTIKEKEIFYQSAYYISDIEIYSKYIKYIASSYKNKIIHIQIGNKVYSSNDYKLIINDEVYTYMIFDAPITEKQVEVQIEDIDTKKTTYYEPKNVQTSVYNYTEYIVQNRDVYFTVNNTSVMVDFYSTGLDDLAQDGSGIDIYAFVSDGKNSYREKLQKSDTGEQLHYTGKITFPIKPVGTKLSIWLSNDLGYLSNKFEETIEDSRSIVNLSSCTSIKSTVYYGIRSVSGKTKENTKVTLKVKGKTYEKNTGNSGKFTFNIPLLKVGTKLKLTFSKSDTSSTRYRAYTRSVTVADDILWLMSKQVMQKDGKITIDATAGEAAICKNDKIVLKVNGKKYTKKIKKDNKKGQIRIKFPMPKKAGLKYRVYWYNKFGQLRAKEKGYIYSVDYIRVGMTKKQLRWSTYGKPKRINYYNAGTLEQWVYKNRLYVYVRNGKVVDWQQF